MAVNQDSFRQRVRRFVVERGQATAGEVEAAFARHIEAARAAKVGHGRLRSEGVKGPSAARAVRVGKRRIVLQCLRNLAHDGFLRRVSPGVYAAPLPRAYSPPQDRAG